MNSASSSNRTAQPSRRAMTLIEVTLVISVLLTLTSILFVGIVAYKKGTDRAHCIQNIARVQKAVRSYGNLSGLGPGDSITGLKDEIVGPGKFVPLEPVCPGGGVYTYGGDMLPAGSTLYLDCDITTHLPSTSAGW